MSQKLLCFTLLILFSVSFCKSQDHNSNYIYDVSPFMNPLTHTASDVSPQLVEFVEGFLVGVGSNINFDSLKACLVDSEEIYANIDLGVQDILTRKIAEVKQGVHLIGKAAQVVPDAAKLCKAADSDVERLIKAVESFKNPVEFIYYVGKSLIINRVDVFHEVEGAVDAYQAKNYTGLGYFVGLAMDTIILEETVVQAPRDTKTDLIEFTRGFLNGIVNASVFDNLKACITDSEDVLRDISNAVTDIKTRVPDAVKQGIALLGQAAEIVPNAAQLCKVSELDMDQLLRLIQSFKSPESFLYYVGKSLLINHVEVIHEVEHIVVAYEAKNYTNLGFWTGKTMDTILLGEKTQVKDTKTDILSFVKGFLEGVGSASAFDNVTACIEDSQDWATEVGQGVLDIKTMKPAEVKQGIHLLGQAAQIVPNAVQLCKAADVDLDKLLKEVESFKNPAAFFYYVGKSLLINHVQVIKEVEHIVDGYEAKNYTELGYWVGKTMDTVFIGQNDTATSEGLLDFNFEFLGVDNQRKAHGLRLW